MMQTCLTNRRCFGCAYFTLYDGACNFYALTGERRGCDVRGCTRRRKTLPHGVRRFYGGVL